MIDTDQYWGSKMVYGRIHTHNGYYISGELVRMYPLISLCHNQSFVLHLVYCFFLGLRFFGYKRIILRYFNIAV